MTGLLVIMFGESILSQEPVITIIRFQLSFILPKLIVQYNTINNLLLISSIKFNSFITPAA